MRGKLITIYGINNIGKSYHAKRLVQRLKKAGKKAMYIKYPIYDLAPTGPALNKILRSHTQTMSEEELQLLFVLNRYHFQPKLESYLARGYTVVAEDYVGTGLAWGIAKGGNPRELHKMNEHLLKEDQAILMTGERSLHAKEAGHIHETQDELVQKCSHVLKKLAKEFRWTVIERAAEKEVTEQKIWRALLK
ncbi:hypothetical protein COV82_02145 [Candidatus Peregrinibacteria bacterium CG11_big_fil_rev_8_21_14_0_20_46_8]|nr:MAG: hypothetical protein COV82_02145 [Candidatus Peregrinibacteria bacterium CG11_big_fil_rev_8_21_14_0_20_46_8]